MIFYSCWPLTSTSCSRKKSHKIRCSTCVRDSLPRAITKKKKCFLKILQPESAFEESEHTGDPFPSYPPPSLAVDGVCKSNVQQSSQEMLLKTSICLEWAQHAILNTLEWCTTPEIAYVFHYCYVLLMFTNI